MRCNFICRFHVGGQDRSEQLTLRLRGRKPVQLKQHVTAKAKTVFMLRVHVI